jgi:nitrate/nitrite transporter NarK
MFFLLHDAFLLFSGAIVEIGGIGGFLFFSCLLRGFVSVESPILACFLLFDVVLLVVRITFLTHQHQRGVPSFARCSVVARRVEVAFM